jgi:hypothetical protein
MGCVLSTLPYTVTGTESPLSGYGYMEGTSMACPHVSGVVALGISYAAKLRKHFKAEELRELLHETARPIEQYWNIENPKQYYKFVTDLGKMHLSSMDLRNYRGKMGNGQVDAYEFLNAIAGAGRPMTFPNVFVALDGQTTVAPALYFENGASESYTVTIEDTSVASCSAEGKNLVFKGLKAGQTPATVKAGSGKSFDFIITVREGANGNGWL